MSEYLPSIDCLKPTKCLFYDGPIKIKILIVIVIVVWLICDNIATDAESI